MPCPFATCKPLEADPAAHGDGREMRGERQATQARGAWCEGDAMPTAALMPRDGVSSLPGASGQ